MARKTMWAVAGALLAFAPLASAATYGLTIDGVRTYASEVISSGDVQIDYRTSATREAPNLDIFLGMTDAEVQAIDEDDTIDVTITLANARFGRNVRDGDMQPTVNGQPVGSPCTARVKDTIDGERGESTVTFKIEAADNNCAAPSPANSGGANFVFTLPRLYGLNAARAVSASVTTDTPGGSGWPDTEVTGVGSNLDCSAMGQAATECTNLEDGVLQRRTAPSATTGRRSPVGIIKFASGLTFSGTSGGTTSINLAAGRTAFLPPLYQALLGSVTLGVASADACEGADPAEELCFLQANGRPFSIGRSGEGRGDLVVNVSGDFRPGDVVYLDMDGNWTPGTGESLSLVDGSMQGAFSLLDVAGNAGAGEGDANEMDREEGVATRRLLYYPNQRDALRPGGYRSSFAVDFSRGATDKAATPASTVANTHVTQYTVVEDDQVAYAIPPGTTGDVGNVRVKCEVATQCTVYLECDHADGRTWFEQVADPIPGRSTLVLTSEGMRTALGMEDDDWTRGRLSCTVYSTREISLQVLTRSTAGVLVNNTYVDD